MNSNFDYVVTYSTFNNTIRKFKETASDENEARAVEGIVEFMKTGVWSEKTPERSIQYTGWGFAPTETAGNLHLGKMKSNDWCYEGFYHHIQWWISNAVARECCQNADFGKAVLKEATIRAKKKDEQRVAQLMASGYKMEDIHPTGYLDALNRAKRRIRYQQKQHTGWEHDSFRMIVEEFDMFTILGVEICDSKDEK